MKWANGQLSPDTVLYGLKLFWWARIGKGLEFIAALSIIADILGPERLRSYGKWLKSSVLGEGGLVFLISLSSVMLLCFMVYTIYRAVHMDLFLHGNFLVKIGIIFAAMLIANLIGAPLVGLLVGFLAVFLVAKPIEALVWVLEKRNGDKWLKSVSLILLLAGFHFDLLGS